MRVKSIFIRLGTAGTKWSFMLFGELLTNRHIVPINWLKNKGGFQLDIYCVTNDFVCNFVRYKLILIASG